MRSCTSDTDGLKSAKVQKSKSTEKDFVALAGTSQKGAKQLLKLADSKTRFTDLLTPSSAPSRPHVLRPMHIDSAMNTNKARGREPEREVK